MIRTTAKKQCGLNLAVAILVIAMPASTQARTPKHMEPSPPQGLAVKGGGGGGVRLVDSGGIDGNATAAGTVDEEFVGPFPSWKNVRDFGAKGDGTTDDSNAIQAALTDLKTVMTNSYSVLYFPAGYVPHHEDLGHHAGAAQRLQWHLDHRRRSGQHRARLGWSTRPDHDEARRLVREG